MLITKMTKQLLLLSTVVASQAWALESLDDQGLSEVSGQASLFNADYIAPSVGVNGGNVGFYRLGVDAEINMNANINALRLGCTGAADGSSNCDIDITHLRITGLGGTSASDSGPPTDFKLTRPFFEFAVRNPAIASQREIVGIRFGAQSALGRMTIGENNNTSSIADDTGITRFSGDMNAIITGATIDNVHACLPAPGSQSGPCPFIDIPASAALDPYDYAALHGQPLILNGKSVGYGTDQNMVFDGLTGSATALGIPLPLNSTLTEPMRFIHDLGVGAYNSGTGDYDLPVQDFYMSLQKEALTWQKVSTGSFTGAVAAQKGWWMSIPTVVVKDLHITQDIYVDGGGAITGSTIFLGATDLGQVPADNCYGSLKFC